MDREEGHGGHAQGSWGWSNRLFTGVNGGPDALVGKDV